MGLFQQLTHMTIGIFNWIVFMIFRLKLINMLTVFNSIAILLVYICTAFAVYFKLNKYHGDCCIHLGHLR